MSALPHPIQYQGSKRNLASRILEYFPDDVQTLFEPFAGSAAITIAAAAQGVAKNFVINDLNKPLSNLLQCMVENPLAMANSYAVVWAEQGESPTESATHFKVIRDQFNQTQRPELLLYLLARCIKGAVRYNKQGLFNQGPDKRRRGTKPSTMQRNILGVSYLLKGRSRFLSTDYAVAIADAQPLDLIYMDPPYQGVSGERDGRYLSGLAFDTFAQSLEKLNQRRLSYIVSYDGKLGDRSYGQSLPETLELERLELDAGRSTTATLLGRNDNTIESLYLSKPLIERLSHSRQKTVQKFPSDLFTSSLITHAKEPVEAVC